MIASDLLRAAVFVALPFVDRPVWIVALAGVAGLGNAIYRPTVNAAMPNLLEEDELERGNALFQTVENMAWAVGPAHRRRDRRRRPGTHAAYWINAVSFVFSALVIRLIPARAPAVGGADQQGALARHRRRALVRAALAGAAGDARRVERRDARGRVRQRRRGRHREGLVQRRRLRLRPALRRVGRRPRDRQLLRRHARGAPRRRAASTGRR